MSKEHEVNKMILDKIRNGQEDPNVKKLVVEILNYENSVANQERARYKEDYISLIEKYASKGADKS